MSCAGRADDFGDLPAPYATLVNDNGPRHPVSSNIYFGTVAPDSEQDGQPNSTATGDDMAGTDDENALTQSVDQLQCVLGEPIPIGIFGNNLTGLNAEIRGFVDWNADGDFSDAGEIFTVPIPAISSAFYEYLGMYVIVPLNASTTQPIALRLRISSKTSVTEPSLGPNGPARDGEVEDYLLRPAIPPIDFGDLPDAPWYPTLLASDGARHTIVAGLCLGQTIDAEADGAPAAHALGDDVAALDDEDGFDPALVNPVPGNPLDFKVRVTTPAGPGAKLYGFVDWNNDGDFEDADERSSIDVAASLANATVDLPWHVPAEAHVGEKLAVRLRLVGNNPTGYTPPLEPNGYAASGEVEDYCVFIHTSATDWGDLPDSGAPLPAFAIAPTLDPITYATTDIGKYNTLEWNSGPEHCIRPDLVIATPSSPLPVDGESDGQPNSSATGDDLSGDDEDGVSFSGITGSVIDNVTPVSADALVRVSATVSVKNETGSKGNCSGLFCFDKGTLPTGLTGMQALPSLPGFQLLTFDFAHPLHLTSHVSTILPKGVFRFRVTTDSAQVQVAGSAFPYLGTGFLDGEVEDYIIDLPLDLGTWWQGTYMDYGDLDDAKYPTKLANNGARHQFTMGQQNIFLGNNPPDGDADGKSSANADGDDAAGLDDEDGFDPLAVALKSGTPANFATKVTSAAPSRLFGFADWNNDGDFADPGEASSVPIAGGSSGATVNLPWQVPFDAVTGQLLAVRLRISTSVALGADGLAPDGEVEDYLVTVQSGYDFGDLPDSAPGTAPGTVVNSSTVTQGDYQTRSADNGPSHKIRADLSLFDVGDPVDGESDGQPSADALGDDASYSGDEVAAFLTPVKQTASNITSNSFNVSVEFLAGVAVDNRTGDRAFLTGFLDANNDGDFADPGESFETQVPSAPGSPVYTNKFTASWTIQKPTTQWTAKLPARFRLSTTNGLGPAGPAPDGEVEDYIATFGFVCGEWWSNAASVPLIDKGTLTRAKLPPGFGSGASNFSWVFGSTQGTAGSCFTAGGTNPLLSPSQLGALPSGMVPYTLTAQRGQMSADSFIGFAKVKDLPNFRSFMQRSPSISGENAAPYEDPDRDGRPNFSEYANGTDPSRPDLPQMPLVLSNSGGMRTLKAPYLRRSGGTNTGGGYMTSELVYQPQGSTNLSSWNVQPSAVAAPSPMPAPPADYEWGAMQLQLSNAVPNAFIRLRTEAQ